MQEIIHKDGTDLDYRKLWREVIMQAMRDACGVYVGSRKPTAKHVKNEAQRWLLSNSRDFRQVCEFAQISPDVVISAAKTMADGGWVVPKGYFNLNFHYFDGGQLKKKGAVLIRTPGPELGQHPGYVSICAETNTGSHTPGTNAALLNVSVV